MFTTTRRGTHRAEGPAVIDYRELMSPISKGATGIAAASAVAATGVAGLQLTPAEAAAPSLAPSPRPSQQHTAPLAANLGTTLAGTNKAQLGTSKIRYRDRGPQVSALQSILNDKGASIAVDGVYGRATRSALLNFQGANGLLVDGVVGNATRSALLGGSTAPAASPTTPAGIDISTRVRPGDRGNHVTVLQTELRERGASIAADGVYGRATGNALRAFQSNAGLFVDGVAGPNTWRALQSDSNTTATGSVAPAAFVGGTSAPVSSGSFDGASIIAMAETQLGKPYVWGASNPGVGFDCSGLVKWVYNNHGISLPRVAKDQTFAGRIIPKSEAQPGDLVAFTSNNYGHIGIYVGGNTIIDASSSRRQIVKRNIWDSNVLFVTYR